MIVLCEMQLLITLNRTNMFVFKEEKAWRLADLEKKRCVTAVVKLLFHVPWSFQVKIRAAV